MNWYDPAAHPGKCFVLLKDYREGDEEKRQSWIEKHGEDPANPWRDDTPPEDIRGELYDLNPKMLNYGDYTILVFEDNEEMRRLGQTLLDEKKAKEQRELHPELP